MIRSQLTCLSIGLLEIGCQFYSNVLHVIFILLLFVNVLSYLKAMYCSVNMCYVCLEKKSELIRNIKCSLSVYKDIIHIIGYPPFNLTWLKTLRIILICEECCLRLRETYQFLEKCLKNSALLRGFRDNLNTSSMSNTENEAELLVKSINTHKDINEVECVIQSEDEQIYTFQRQPNFKEIGDLFVTFEDSLIKDEIICKKEADDKQDNISTEITEETEDVFVNVSDYFVKKEKTWKREEVDDTEEYPMDNNSTDHSNVHSTNTDDVTSGFTSKQVHTSEEDLNTSTEPYNCSTDSKTSIIRSPVERYTRIHTGEKPYKCARCEKCFRRHSHLLQHIPVHTGEKPYHCTECSKCFSFQSSLMRHMRVHTPEKPHKCARCERSFSRHSHLLQHQLVHTGDKPYHCTECNKCFRSRSNLVRHTLIHTGEVPYKCTRCERCFRRRSYLVSHMRTHTGEKPYLCSVCNEYFKLKSQLNRHLRVHTK